MQRTTTTRSSNRQRSVNRTGAKVVAEGVETEEQLTFLRKHHCDEIQGCLFSKPITSEAFMELIADGEAMRATRLA